VFAAEDANGWFGLFWSSGDLLCHWNVSCFAQINNLYTQSPFFKANKNL
jgi:hypothetical protein